jgi:hypothetical protein
VECKATSKKRCVIWYQSLKLDLASEMGRRNGCWVFCHKMLTLDKVEMVVVKVKKAIAKETCKAKKLTKLATVAELGFAKKLSKTLKGEMKKASKPFNPESGEIGASTWKESWKREASKDNIQVVEQL